MYKVRARDDFAQCLLDTSCFMQKHEFICIWLVVVRIVFTSLYREKGGAYGAGAIFSDGIFSFYSYRFVSSCVWMLF